MLTLYDFPPSGNGYKVRLTLRELSLPFRYREVDILKGETRLPWFLTKSPVGQIPVLELDDGTCLSESTAIMFFLAEGTALLPADRLLRTRLGRRMCRSMLGMAEVCRMTDKDSIVAQLLRAPRQTQLVTTSSTDCETTTPGGISLLLPHKSTPFSFCSR